MPISTGAILALCLATVIAAVVSGLAGRVARLKGADGKVPAWGALAVGLAYAVGQFGVAAPSFPPGDVTDRIPGIALASAIVAAILANRRAVWPRVLGYVALASLVFGVMLGPVLGTEDLPRETLLWLAATAVVCGLAAVNLATLDGPKSRVELWFAMGVLSLGAGVVLVLANSAVLFQLAAILAFFLGVSLLASWGRPVGGGLPVASAVLMALVVEGFVYAFLPAASAGLLALAPVLVWLTRLGPLGRLGVKGRSVVAGLLMLLPVSVAIGIVLASKSADNSGY
jgi:hypothetical protein